MKYDYIPYNPKLTKLARNLRNNPTLPERIMWNKCLKNNQTGYKFLRQKPLDRFIADFYCPELLLVIEIDGVSHKKRAEEDHIRTQHLENLGIIVIRYTNNDVLENLEYVKQDLQKQISLVRETYFHKFLKHAQNTPRDW